MKKYILFCIITFSFCFQLNAQLFNKIDSTGINLKIETMGAFTNGDNAPFWLNNNKYGLGWYNKNNQYLRTGIFSNKKIINDNISLRLGGDFVIANQFESDFFIQQLYLDLAYKKVNLSIGQKERPILFRNNDLTSGSLTISNNARPIPEVEFATSDFILLPYTKNTLSFTGGLSYGILTDDNYKKKIRSGDYVQNVLFHYKHLYIKFEKPESSWNIIAGVESATQWGGDNYKNHIKIYSNPHSVSDAFRVLTMQSGGSNSQEGEQVNKLGETFGSYHLIFNKKNNNGSYWKIYYEHIIDDRSGMEMNNFPDDTWGGEYNFERKQLLSTILFEFIYTKDQSGPVTLDDNGNRIYNSTADDYYNSSFYIANQYYGFAFGTPLLTSPLYLKGENLQFINNRIIAYHIGLKGYFHRNLAYKALFTHSRGYGTPLVKFEKPKNEIMSSFELLYSHPKLNSWNFTSAIAYDNSNILLGKNIGIQFKISKEFKLSK